MCQTMPTDDISRLSSGTLIQIDKNCFPSFNTHRPNANELNVLQQNTNKSEKCQTVEQLKPTRMSTEQFIEPIRYHILFSIS